MRECACVRYCTNNLPFWHTLNTVDMAYKDQTLASVLYTKSDKTHRSAKLSETCLLERLGESYMRPPQCVLPRLCIFAVTRVHH